MSAQIDRIVVIPRYTALIGTTDVFTVPMDARAYATAGLVAWQGSGLGSTPATVVLTVQESPDLENWFDVSVLEPDHNEEDTATAAFRYPWIRVKAEVTGADPGVTCWLVGDFVRRDTQGAGRNA